MKHLAKLHGYNYFYFSLLAIFLSFLPVYLSSQGISMQQIGNLIAIGSFVGIVSQPLWGLISDKWQTVRKVLLILLAISVCIGTILFQSASSQSLLLLIIAWYFFYMPTDPLTESMNYRMSQQLQVSFGSIRMFGAIGYASTSLIVGYLANWLGTHAFAYVFAAYGCLAWCLCWTLPDVRANSQKLTFASLQRFFAVPSTLRFFLLVLILAIPHRTNDSFLGVYVQSLGGTSAQVGLAWFCTAASEILFFAFSYWWLQRLPEMWLIAFAAALYVLRFGLCSIVTEPSAVVYLQLLQGLTFVVFYTAAIQHLNKIVPEEWKATGQTVLAVLFFGLSGIIGSSLGGWIFEQYGGDSLYQAMAIVAFAGLIGSIAVAMRKRYARDSA
ncbi:MFS transporter [Brevibacillus fulvus]|uniref:PPP family 3-phenylpropionic acid transporter n=1 Tax=Brevibacillus fulvus TaxID=1125967 RepID=A0A938Y5Q6_9BACL|nr:MFS transporter [Brevibacillus fulvus]MBM7592047.1 PPP family 3-phenylpropionic acid transporter [Brevibacillus fulvus]